MALRFSNPLDALLDLQRALESTYSSSWLGSGLSSGGAFPPINVFRREHDFVIVVELPGVGKDHIDVQVKGNQLRITGRKDVPYDDNTSIHRRERLAGEFDRVVDLPAEVDPEGVTAEYKNGVLALLLPRSEADKPRSVAIG